MAAAHTAQRSPTAGPTTSPASDPRLNPRPVCSRMQSLDEPQPIHNRICIHDHSPVGGRIRPEPAAQAGLPSPGRHPTAAAER